jgi:hypothetical protein
VRSDFKKIRLNAFRLLSIFGIAGLFSLGCVTVPTPAPTFQSLAVSTDESSRRDIAVAGKAQAYCGSPEQ